MLKISELEDGQKNVSLEFILIRCLDTNKTRDDGYVVAWLIGDESGTTEFGAWNCDLNVGDVLHVYGGYVSSFQGKRRLFVSKAGTINRVRTVRKIFKVNECHLSLIEEFSMFE